MASLLQSVTELFTVGDETYIGTHRTVPVSFMTDCKSYTTNYKSDTTNCKFYQHFQSATLAINAIQLTITGVLISYAPPPGAYWLGGGTENVSPVGTSIHLQHVCNVLLSVFNSKYCDAFS